MDFLHSIIEFIFLLISEFPNWAANLVKAITWPIVALITLWVVRKEICSLLAKIPTIMDRLEEIRGIKLSALQTDVNTKPALIENPESTPEETIATGNGNLISGEENIKKWMQNLYPYEDLEPNIYAFEEWAKKSVTNTDKDRASLFLCSVAATSNFLAHERTYRAIFGSQISLLKRLTANSIDVTDAQQTYQQAAKINAALYKSYTFDLWLNYLISVKLCARQENTLFITKSGRAFLHYLVSNNIPDNKPL